MPIYAYHNHHEIPLSSIERLSSNEESGVLMQHRRHQLPSNWPSPVLRFMAPSHHPLPKRYH